METTTGQLQAEPDALPVPAWIAPILQRECDARDQRRRQFQDEMRGAADAINKRLGFLGIVPLRPAEWTPQSGLRRAVLLEPGHCDVDEWGVEVGWDHGIVLYAYHSDGVTHEIGALNTVQDAADARRGPRAVAPEPPDNGQLAQEEIDTAARLDPDDYDAGEVAILAGIRALARAVLALNDTIGRLGVRQALRQAAALGAIPLDEVGLTPEEKQLLGVIFPRQDAPADTPQ